MNKCTVSINDWRSLFLKWQKYGAIYITFLGICIQTEVAFDIFKSIVKHNYQIKRKYGLGTTWGTTSRTDPISEEHYINSKITMTDTLSKSYNKGWKESNTSPSNIREIFYCYFRRFILLVWSVIYVLSFWDNFLIPKRKYEK